MINAMSGFAKLFNPTKNFGMYLTPYTSKVVSSAWPRHLYRRGFKKYRRKMRTKNATNKGAQWTRGITSMPVPRAPALGLWPDKTRVLLSGSTRFHLHAVADDYTLAVSGDDSHDPWLTHGAVIFAGWNQYAAMYRRYKTTSSAIDVRVIRDPLSATEDLKQYEINLMPSTSTPSAVECGQSYNKRALVDLALKTNRLRGWMSSKKLYGAYHPETWASVTAAPSVYNWAWYVRFTVVTSATVECIVELQLSHWIDFADRTTVTATAADDEDTQTITP